LARLPRSRLKEARYRLPGWKFLHINTHKRGVCKSRNPTRNTRNPPGTPPGTPGTLPGTPGTPPGTRWNTSYEATHVFLYKFTCFALNRGRLFKKYFFRSLNGAFKPRKKDTFFTFKKSGGTHAPIAPPVPRPLYIISNARGGTTSN
jgi:hypothetical protein